MRLQVVRPAARTNGAFGLTSDHQGVGFAALAGQFISFAALAGQFIRLRTYNQKITVAAMQIALMKVWAHRSYRVAMRRQSLSLPNMRSIRFRCV